MVIHDRRRPIIIIIIADVYSVYLFMNFERLVFTPNI